MPNLDNIRAKIKATIETITDLGPVYTRFVYGRTWAEIIEKFKRKNVKAYYGVMFKELERNEDSDDEDHEITRTWQIFAFRQVNDAQGTQILFENALESLAGAFALLPDLGGLVNECEYLQITNMDWAKIGDVFCHTAVMELKTSEYYEPLTLPIPEIPILISPTNGFSEGSVNQAFNWGAVLNATLYDFELANDVDFTNIELQIMDLNITSWTIPEDLTIASGTYYWRVRAKNAQQASNWSTVWSFSISTISYEPEAVILFNRMTIAPTNARKLLISNLITDLKFNNLWSKFDIFVMLAGETAQASKLDWKNYRDARVFGGATFTVDRGFAMSGTTSKNIKTGFTPNIDAVNFSQNSASVLIYSRTDQNGTVADFHINDTSGKIVEFYMRLGGNFLGILNNVDVEGSIANANSLGLHGLDRAISSQFRMLKNGVNIKTVTSTSNGIQSIEGVLGVRNTATDGAQSYDRPTSRQYAFYSIGGSFSDAEHTTLYSLIQAYLTAIGAQV